MKFYSLALLLFFLSGDCDHSKKANQSTNQNATKEVVTSAPTKEQDSANFKQKKAIVFYGDDSCPACKLLKEECIAKGIKFEFVDLNTEAGGNAFGEKLMKSNFKGDVVTPVLEIEEQLYMKPSIETVIKLISE